MRHGGVERMATCVFRTRTGTWAVAQSPILITTITLQRLRKRGYESMLDVYLELNPSLCEPPYARTARPVVCHMVVALPRASPCQFRLAGQATRLVPSAPLLDVCHSIFEESRQFFKLMFLHQPRINCKCGQYSCAIVQKNIMFGCSITRD